MKFNVGDLLIDNGNAGDDILREAVVIDIITVEGDPCAYFVEYSNGDRETLSPDWAEAEYQVAPKGSVAWLIDQLSALPQLAPVNYFEWDELHLVYNRELVESVEYDEDWEAVELW